MPPFDKDPLSKPIVVIGAGSWGTALALHLAKSQQEVRLWSYATNHIMTMAKERMNERYLPGVLFPPSLKPTENLADALKDANDILIAVPSSGFYDTLLTLKPLVKKPKRFICTTKGMDFNTHSLLHHLTTTILGSRHQFSLLSGPSYAKEVSMGLPTAVVIATQFSDFANDLVKRFNHRFFRTYLSTDVIGVEVCGIVKNVLAIATGISDGMKFGANARSALITRGLAEMTRLGLALGAQAETFIGLAGMGDLVLTCTDNQSRNRRFGLAVGQGKDPSAAEAEIQQVIEGKQNADLILTLAKKHHIDMPITECVTRILHGELTINDAMQNLFLREIKRE